MDKRLTYVAAAILALHGVVHFLGLVAYFELATFEELPYKTTLLGGTIDVGEVGIRAFGVLSAVAGIGFIGAAVALVVDWDHWRPALVAVTLFSLVLTSADYTVASAGALLNLIILGALVYERQR